MRRRIPIPIPTAISIVTLLFTTASLFAQERVLYQVSTLDALVGGVFDGETTLGGLALHGDFGIGTFNAVDGEMLLLDGLFYRIDGAGKVRLAGINEKTPFAAVTQFEANQRVPADSAFFKANLSSDRTADMRKVER